MIKDIKNRYSIKDILFILGISPASVIKTPLKDEKTPSLKLYFDTNSFFDYSANIGGDQIDLYAHLRQISNADAIEELHKRVAPITIAKRKEKYSFEFLGKEEDEVFEERAAIMEYEGNIKRETAEKFAYQSVFQHRQNVQQLIFQSLYEYEMQDLDSVIIEYLLIKRTINEENIKKFRLFTIKNPKKTITFLKSSFSDYELKISGLFSKGFFIFQKYRLVIPYIENRKITYLRARYFDKDANNSKNPKYKSLFNISKTLPMKRFYNLDLLKTKPKEILITEGEFDCIIANQFGYSALGIAGVSAFPDRQIELLNNKDVYLMFDSDGPGQKAADDIGLKISDYANKIVNWKIENYKDLTEYANANS